MAEKTIEKNNIAGSIFTSEALVIIMSGDLSRDEEDTILRAQAIIINSPLRRYFRNKEQLEYMRQKKKGWFR